MRQMRAEVSFTLEPPVECTQDQFKEWIEYNIQQRADIKLDNPLCGYDLDLASNQFGRACITIG